MNNIFAVDIDPVAVAITRMKALARLKEPSVSDIEKYVEILFGEMH